MEPSTSLPSSPKLELCRRLAELEPVLLKSCMFANGKNAQGLVQGIQGAVLQVTGCHAGLGEICLVEVDANTTVEAEVLGFAGEKLLLMCPEALHGLKPKSHVRPTGRGIEVPVGESLLGRVIDGAGKPLDGLGDLHCDYQSIQSFSPPNPFARQSIHKPLDVGVNAINALFTVGEGQRIGLFAGSGVGKSVLLGQLCRQTEADIVVVCLIGERGRELNEFIQKNLTEHTRKRTVIIATPADTSPLMRVRGAWLASAIADAFKKRGNNVLLLMDSLTRFAQAQREIALMLGEPPATKGYPPSVFTKLPELVEQAGCGVVGEGNVTALYTVLVEGDDHNDPVSDTSRAILDGHIVLSRKLAQQGHFPAIDIEASVSRVMQDVVSDTQYQYALKFKQLYSYFQSQQSLLDIGAYQAGSNPKLDSLLAHEQAIRDFLAQGLALDVEESVVKGSDRQLLQKQKVHSLITEHGLQAEFDDSCNLNMLSAYIQLKQLVESIEQISQQAERAAH